MRIALVDSTPNPGFYSLPLLKIGAWRRDLGDECELFSDRLPEAGAFDEIWISTVFTFHIPHAMGIVKEAVSRCDRVVVGGIAASLLPRYFEQYDCTVHHGFLPDAEVKHPDYSLLPKPPKYSIAHMSRGCIRKCGFCVIRHIEPQYEDRPHWTGDLYPPAEKVVFYDNNWLAKDVEVIKRDTEILRGLCDCGQIKKIDFNQGLDARLLTPEKADLLEGLPIHPVRFAFDHMGEDGHYQDAVRLMSERGFTIFLSYTLYNYTDTPQDFYYRLKESVKLVEELDIPAIDSYPMRYSPVMQPDFERQHVGPHWTLEKLRGFVALRAAHTGPNATVTTHSHNTMRPLEEFEYWYGKTPEEFDRLVGYPEVHLLARRRLANLRLMRARGETWQGK